MGASLHGRTATGQEGADGLIRKIAAADGATYRARQLVVYMGEQKSSAVVEVHADRGTRHVRAQGGKDRTEVWKDGTETRLWNSELAWREMRPAPVKMKPKLVLEKFDVKVGAMMSLGSVSLVPLDLIRRSDEAFLQRMWVDPVNGMVHRREVYGDEGKLLGMSTLLDMEWGDGAGPVPKVKARVKEDAVLPKAKGEAPRELPYDYQLVSAHRLEADGDPVDQWLYTDGVHALSVFRQKGTLSEPDGFEPVELDKTTAYAGPGPGTWVWQGGRSVWTVVAEEPQLDPVELTEDLPQGGPSRLTRLGAWWAKAYHVVADRL